MDKSLNRQALAEEFVRRQHHFEVSAFERIKEQPRIQLEINRLAKLLEAVHKDGIMDCLRLCQLKWLCPTDPVPNCEECLQAINGKIQ